MAARKGFLGTSGRVVHVVVAAAVPLSVLNLACCTYLPSPCSVPPDPIVTDDDGRGVTPRPSTFSFSAPTERLDSALFVARSASRCLVGLFFARAAVPLAPRIDRTSSAALAWSELVSGKLADLGGSAWPGGCTLRGLPVFVFSTRFMGASSPSTGAFTLFMFVKGRVRLDRKSGLFFPMTAPSCRQARARRGMGYSRVSSAGWSSSG